MFKFKKEDICMHLIFVVATIYLSISTGLCVAVLYHSF